MKFRRFWEREKKTLCNAWLDLCYSSWIQCSLYFPISISVYLPVKLIIYTHTHDIQMYQPVSSSGGTLERHIHTRHTKGSKQSSRIKCSWVIFLSLRCHQDAEWDACYWHSVMSKLREKIDHTAKNTTFEPNKRGTNSTEIRQPVYFSPSLSRDGSFIALYHEYDSKT